MIECVLSNAGRRNIVFTSKFYAEAVSLPAEHSFESV